MLSADVGFIIFGLNVITSVFAAYVLLARTLFVARLSSTSSMVILFVEDGYSSNSKLISLAVSLFPL